MCIGALLANASKVRDMNFQENSSNGSRDIDKSVLCYPFIIDRLQITYIVRDTCE
jgi:hypothetical protein